VAQAAQQKGVTFRRAAYERLRHHADLALAAHRIIAEPLDEEGLILPPFETEHAWEHALWNALGEALR
jgi:hypothetical protein